MLLQNKLTDAEPHIHAGFKLIEGTAFSPWEVMIAYANYLWYTDDYERCAPIVARMALDLETVEQGEVINNKYFLRPLMYRVREQLGEPSWQETLTAAEKMTLNQQFEEAIETWKL